MNDSDDVKNQNEEDANVDDGDPQDGPDLLGDNITSHPLDPPVDSLVQRLRGGTVEIPPFQRAFVWNINEASRFIESLISDLPVPGIFLQEDANGIWQVIDGQQRLRSLQYFYDGRFPSGQTDSDGKEKPGKVFKLSNVQEAFNGKTYEELDQKTQNKLNNAAIHATIIKEDQDKSEDSGIFHIFERLNSGGRKLTPQEIRRAIYQGPLIDLIMALNDYDSWRTIFGRRNSRMKDQELILRFFAMYENSDEYKNDYKRIKTMSGFLNKYAKANRHMPKGKQAELAKLFKGATDLLVENVERPFRLTTAINTAFYEAGMVGLARRLDDGKSPAPDPEKVNQAYLRIRKNETFLLHINRATSNPVSVATRLEIATEEFKKV